MLTKEVLFKLSLMLRDLHVLIMRLIFSILVLNAFIFFHTSLLNQNNYIA